MKVVDIQPPDYKHPVTMLRNLADQIEAGDYGEVETIVAVAFGSEGLCLFGGGRDSDMASCAFVLGAAHHKLLRIPSDPA